MPASSLAERKMIDRAKGILMKARGLTEDEAYAATSLQGDERAAQVVDIAQSVVTAAELLK